MVKNDNQRIVAAFDFDGTLTYRDTLFPFLIYHFGLINTLYQLALLIPYFVLYVFKRLSRQQIKEKVLKAFFYGMPLNRIKELGAYFAEEALSKHLRPEGIKRFQWHLGQGHFCILISASLDIYLEPWAKKKGFHDVLSSSLKTNQEGNVTGALNGKNCRGKEKVRRLEEVMGNRETYLLYAYGDSQGDRELLAFADYPFYRSFA